MQRFFLLVFAAFLFAIPARAQRAMADSNALRADVIAIAKTFFAQWRAAWEYSERGRRDFPRTDVGPGTFAAYPHIHCHYDDVTFGRQGVRTLVESTATAFSVCPTWVETPVTEFEDERRTTPDMALIVDRRLAMRDARAPIIAMIDSAARSLPASGFLAGQRVRFLLDQRDVEGALTAARECQSGTAWCASLAGYVYAARGEFTRADSAFRVASLARSVEARCAWLDVRALIDISGRSKYADMSCAARDSLGARLLWLGDPMLGDAVNERRVEHYARRVNLALRQATGADERYDWGSRNGHDARAEMVVRYGWPSRIQWGGPAVELEHTGWLRDPQRNYSPPNSPYTSYEYSPGRVHMVPVWRAVLAPFGATAKDWSIETLPLPGAMTLTDSARWPAELFAPPFPIVQFRGQQFVTLRRQHTVVLGGAADLDADRLDRLNGTRIERVALITSDRPDSSVRIATTSGAVGTPAVLRGNIPSQPTLVAIEMPADGTRPAARTRLGITPPQPLAAMKAGDVAVSDPVILRPPARGDTLPNEPDAALARMAGSTRVPPGGKIGVYWETYGFHANDSVEVAVWIERFTPQGIIRRFGIALSIATDLNTPVAISWVEPQPGHSSHFVGGQVPIIGRSVILDASSLPKGDYRLEVAVAKKGRPPIRGRTTFTVD